MGTSIGKRLMQGNLFKGRLFLSPLTFPSPTASVRLRVVFNFSERQSSGKIRGAHTRLVGYATRGDHRGGSLASISCLFQSIWEKVNLAKREGR